MAITIAKNITLNEQADGSGFYRFRINKSGVKLSKSFAFTNKTTKNEALAKCIQFSNQERDEITLTGKSYSQGRGVLLSQVLDAYGKSDEVREMKSHKTRMARCRLLINEESWKQYIHKTIDEIKNENLMAGFVNTLKQGGYKPATINHYLVIISRSIKWASNQANKSEWKYLQDISITKNHFQQVKNERLVFINDEDWQAILDSEKDEETKNAFIFLEQTACRRGELLKLKWDDVNLDEKFIDFRNTKSGRDRRIPISKKLLEILNEKYKTKMDDKVFHFYYYYLSHHFHRTIIKLGFLEKGYVLHDIRARKLTKILVNGGDVISTAALSGHQNLQNLKRYSRMKEKFGQEHLRKLIETD